MGDVNFLSITTLRPRGPRVTLTESASLLTPRSRARRASVSNARILAAMRTFRGTNQPGLESVPATRRRQERLSSAWHADEQEPGLGWPTKSAPAPEGDRG